MPSASPSPIKRPSLNERTSSTHSLSSSGRQTTAAAHKVHRPHVVSRHSRNVSHGKGLSKLGKTQSTASINTDHQHQQPHQHQRRKSGGITPPDSPRTPLVNRNGSHVTLPKNTSYGNLRKNHSASTLARNLSHPALKKVGLTPAPRQKSKEKKDGVFQLGDRSSDEEEEGEWEDSTTLSPEVTRNNSKTATPARVTTPNGEQNSHGRSESDVARPERTSSPPQPDLRNNNRSVPNLRNDSMLGQSHIPPDPALLHQQPRASRAPPAMSTVSAHAGPSQLVRSESSKSFTHISHAEASLGSTAPATSNVTSASMNVTPATSGPRSGPVPVASSIEGGVSHFLPMETPSSAIRQIADESDEDSPSNFLSNYKPQPSESPEKTKTLHKARMPQNASRTQQKLELQRREIMRAGAATPTTSPPTGLGLNLSSASLHNRASSRNRNRSLAGEIKAVKQDYESAVKQLTVVRRFRSPIVESMNRLKEKSALPQDIGLVSSSGAFSKSRPQSRRGPNPTNVNGHTKTGPGVSRSLEDKGVSPLASRSNSRGRAGRVRFQRQSSHDDIEVTPSQGSLDGAQDDEHCGLTPEEALIRRIWDSREVYDAGEQVPA